MNVSMVDVKMFKTIPKVKAKPLRPSKFDPVAEVWPRPSRTALFMIIIILIFSKAISFLTL